MIFLTEKFPETNLLTNVLRIKKGADDVDVGSRGGERRGSLNQDQFGP